MRPSCSASAAVAGTTVRDIADEVGILSGSLYHYFGSKDAIVFEIVIAFVDDLNERYEATQVPGETGRERIDHMVAVSFEAAADHPFATEIYQNESALSSQPETVRSPWRSVGPTTTGPTPSRAASGRASSVSTSTSSTSIACSGIRLVDGAIQPGLTGPGRRAPAARPDRGVPRRFRGGRAGGIGIRQGCARARAPVRDRRPGRCRRASRGGRLGIRRSAARRPRAQEAIRELRLLRGN